MAKLVGLMGLDANVDYKGASEKDIVYSALDEIMSGAVLDNWNYAIHKDLNFRDACLVNAITEIKCHYEECGITL